MPALHPRLNKDALDVIFCTARTYNGWLDRTVSDETVRETYDLMKWGPTSANSSPARFLLLRMKAAKERLRPALAAGNVEKMMSAPLTVIVVHDLGLYKKLPKACSALSSFPRAVCQQPGTGEVTARRSSTLQGAYFIIAARALALDCGPMSGFENAKVDEEFFACRA
jgi:3-hydroxypropanoate dehydrogenase